MKNMLKMLSEVLLVVAVMIICGCEFVEFHGCDKLKHIPVASDPSPTMTTEQPPVANLDAGLHQDPVPTRTVFRVLPVYASRLWKDYEDNEVRADQQYKFTDNGGIELFVKGYVTDIGKDLFHQPYLSLRTPNMFLGVRADVSE